MTIAYAFTPDVDPHARGAAFGAAWSREIAATWSAYAGFFALFGLGEAEVRATGLAALDEIDAWAPGLDAELRGVADGAGVDLWRVAALNARTEVIAPFRAPTECSTSVVLPADGPPRTVQSWDWHERMTDVKVVHVFTPSAGRAVKTLTEFGILGKIGLNSAGLGVHFNLLQHERDGGTGGVPVHIIARRVLDEASSLTEAADIIASAPVTASTSLTIASWREERADAATFEISPAGVVRIDPEHGALARTNHFVDPGLAQGERRLAGDSTFLRRRVLQERRDLLASASLVDRAGALVQHGDGWGVCSHADVSRPEYLRSQTQALAALDLARTRLWVRDGQPCLGDLASWNMV